MKNTFSKILISFVLMFSAFGFVSSQSVIDSLSEMELFKYYGVTPLILNIHKEIGMGHTDDGIIYSYTSLLQNIKNYVDIDVSLYLKKTIYPESSLNSFLSKSEMLLNTANAFIVHLDNLKTDLAQKKSNCDSVKEISDKNFALALKDFDSISMDKYLTSSLENEQCSVEARITYNAYTKMQSQIKYYYDVLKKKYDYFFTYKYDIIKSLEK